MNIKFGNYVSVSSPIELIYLVMLSGEFEDRQPESGQFVQEMQIGVMNVYEKSIHTARVLVIDYVRGLKSFFGNEDILKQNEKIFMILDQWIEILLDMLILSISTRLTEEIGSLDFHYMTFLKGFRIFLYNNEESGILDLSKIETYGSVQ